ncbi:MAG TPA: glycoside hydrolase family 3 N-terminal domain-containing protein [Bryobacteraceae bacterium]
MNRREFTRALTGAGALMAELQTAQGAEQANQSVANAPYKNPKLPIPRRVADLLSRMTLEEKVEQISGGFHHGGVIDPTGKYNDQNYLNALRQMRGISTQIVPAHDRAVLRNAIQRYQIEKTRLGIPALFIGEGLHGFMENGSTSFPQAIGLASTWDPDLIHQVFTVVAEEASAVGVKQLFAPVVHIGREPRWGRVGESLGEDPYLISRMGVAAVSAFQGGKAFPVSKHHTLATLKHFVGYGQPEGGRNDAPRNCAERVLREAFFPAYKACVQEGHVASIMAAYNEIQGGVPCHINHWLLTRVLREEWGFDGYVTSDGGALEMLVNFHHIAEDNAGAARMALAAGVDFDLSNGAVYKTLVDEVKAGRVAEKQVDGAAGKILAAKFRAGVFDDPYVDPDYAQRITSSKPHRDLALKAAQKTIILLKNEGNLLPLDVKKLKTIAVIGPNASAVHLGAYSRQPAHEVSILDGIRKRVGPGVKVLFEEGCDISSAQQGWTAWYQNKVDLPDPATQPAKIKAATEAARKADVAILILGGNESTCREAWNDKHLGDRDSLDLLGAQNKLVKSVLATGKPTVVFLINGRPLSINYVAEHVPAILEGWYIGQEGGTAAANVLFGDVNPGGKLPITFPRAVGEVPDYYNHKPSLHRPYLFQKPGPLFPFGWGLSYTTFKFSNLKLSKPQIGLEGEASVSVDVTNTGSREGDEVAQMYIRDRVSSITRPVKELKGFERVTLKPGETKTVHFKLTPAELGFYNINMDWVVESGMFDIMVGPNSAETTSVPLQVTAA